jgi:methionyl-tRNA synthetase
MSKSVGNVIDPFPIIEKYGSDYFRYFLAAEINFGNNGDFSQISFEKKMTELADDIGNLLQRILVLISKNCAGKVPAKGVLQPKDIELLNHARNNKVVIEKYLQDLHVRGICDSSIELARMGNRYINEEEPWKLVKTDKARAETVLYVLFELVRMVGIYFEPITPNSCRKLFEQMQIPAEFQTLDSIDKEIPSGNAIGKPTILFPKIQL